MNGRVFLEAMSEVDDRYYVEAEQYLCRPRRWARFASLAACAAILIALPLLWARLSGQTAPGPDSSGPISWDGAQQDVRLTVNEIGAPGTVTSNIALMWEDYRPMSYEELLAYFDVSLPVAEVLPDLALRPAEWGVYQSEDRSVYFDGNAVVFESADGVQRLQIVLSKVMKHIYDVFDLTGDTIQFTEVNGRELAVFHHTADDGGDCYYTEFLQNDVAFLVGAENLSAGDYGNCLQALVDSAPPSGGGDRTITGEVSAVDPYANRVGILLDEGTAPPYSRGYGIDLPESLSAGDYALGDRIEVTYTGEPATICTIWAEQLVGIRLLP